MSNRYLKLREGIYEHQGDGRLSPTELASLIRILMLADCSTGIWRGSSYKLAAKSGTMSRRTAVLVLNRLEAKGYIKRFRRSSGRGDYPIGINKYEVTLGLNKDKRLNLAESAGPDYLVYDSLKASKVEAVPIEAMRPIHPDAATLTALFASSSDNDAVIMSEFLHDEDASTEVIRETIVWGLAHKNFWMGRLKTVEKFIKHWKHDVENGLRDQYSTRVAKEWRKAPRKARKPSPTPSTGKMTGETGFHEYYKFNKAKRSELVKPSEPLETKDDDYYFDEDFEEDLGEAMEQADDEDAHQD